VFCVSFSSHSTDRVITGTDSFGFNTGIGGRQAHHYSNFISQDRSTTKKSDGRASSGISTPLSTIGPVLIGSESVEITLHAEPQPSGSQRRLGKWTKGRTARSIQLHLLFLQLMDLSLRHCSAPGFGENRSLGRVGRWGCLFSFLCLSRFFNSCAPYYMSVCVSLARSLSPPSLHPHSRQHSFSPLPLCVCVCAYASS